MEALLLKGSVANISWSLVDMKYRRSRLLLSKPSSWMVWGVNERFQWVLNRLPFEAFIYAVGTVRVASGLALYGVALESIELAEKYWPHGEGWKAFYVEVKAAAPGVLEEPENPERWKLITPERMKEKGVRVLPGPQRLKEAEATALKALLGIA